MTRFGRMPRSSALKETRFTRRIHNGEKAALVTKQNRFGRGRYCLPKSFYLSDGPRTEAYRLTGERKDDWKKATREDLA